MAVTLSNFRTAFKPEFDDVDDDLIQTCIDEAVLRVKSPNYGSKKDLATRYLAAHLLSIRSAGQNARLQNDINSTIYGKEYLFIMRTVSYGARVAG